MKRLLLLVLLLSVPLEAQKFRLRFSPVQPTGGSFAVTNVSGTLTHGSSVTVTGAQFGTKSTAAPIKYDDFQSLTTGQDLSASGWQTAGGIHPVASTARLRSGTPFTKNALSAFSPSTPTDGDASNFYLDGKAFIKGYFDGWLFTHVVSGTPGNQKPLRWHNTGAGSPNVYFNIYTPPGNDLNAGGRDGTSFSDSVFASVTPADFYENWRHVQYALDIGSGSSASDGSIQMWVDSVLVYNHTSIPVWDGGSGGIPEVWVGNYLRTDEGAAMQNFWESVYVDNAWARVEIGNNSAYASCTQREIQIPSAWSATSITVTLNRGSFASLSGKYLFVVTSAGTASAGFLLP